MISGMASFYKIERVRGATEFVTQLEQLRTKWPLAFPRGRHDVRPLAVGATRVIAETFGWSMPYALGVLGVWKGTPSYCHAVLRHERINLDGSPTGDEPDAAAKD